MLKGYWNRYQIIFGFCFQKIENIGQETNFDSQITKTFIFSHSMGTNNEKKGPRKIMGGSGGDG